MYSFLAAFRRDADRDSGAADLAQARLEAVEHSVEERPHGIPKLLANMT
jgi:hypothetical protein